MSNSVPMRKRKLKVFTGNYNGIQRGLIAAYSKKQAAKLIQTSQHDFNNHWYEIDPREPAISEPFVVFLKTFTGFDDWVKRVF